MYQGKRGGSNSCVRVSPCLRPMRPATVGAAARPAPCGWPCLRKHIRRLIRCGRPRLTGPHPAPPRISRGPRLAPSRPAQAPPVRDRPLCLPAPPGLQSLYAPAFPCCGGARAAGRRMVPRRPMHPPPAQVAHLGRPSTARLKGDEAGGALAPGGQLHQCTNNVKTTIATMQAVCLPRLDRSAKLAGAQIFAQYRVNRNTPAAWYNRRLCARPCIVAVGTRR